jgi:hypothetical protein
MVGLREVYWESGVRARMGTKLAKGTDLGVGDCTAIGMCNERHTRLTECGAVHPGLLRLVVV